MEESCKATITLGDSKITFEGPAGFVEAQIEKFAATQNAAIIPSNANGGNSHSAQTSTEKQLVADKRPRGHHEIVTLLAYALTESGKKEFTEEDVRRAYIRADVRPPKSVSQALRDAKSKFDYITTGSKRGTYRLTNHGDRTVRFDLPR
ncbi:MAG: hypothetical protein WBD25_10335 [Terriglobales bacterium]